HLYYRFRGERCQSLRREGLVIDIKGEGGFVVCPPSTHEDTGLCYYFLNGSWTFLNNLPTINTGSLLNCKPRDDIADNVARLGAVRVGVRNNTLFRTLMRHAPHCDDIEALRDVAFTVHYHDFEEPLPTAEVENTIRSVWRYEGQGQNWIGRTGRIFQFPCD